MIRILPILLLIVFAGCNASSGDKNKKRVVVDVPATDSLPDEKNWNATDYIMGIASFKTMKDEDPAAFAKHIRMDGVALFEKITNHSKYDSLYMGKNLEQRFIINTSLYNAVKTLTKLCNDPQKENNKLILGHEFIRCSMASMALFKTSISLVNEKFPDMEGLTEIQRDGLKKMKLGVLGMIRGSLITIHTDYALYRQDDIIELSRFIIPYIKDVKSFMDKDQQEKVGEEIQKVKNSHTYQEAKLAFSE